MNAIGTAHMSRFVPSFGARVLAGMFGTCPQQVVV